MSETPPVVETPPAPKPRAEPETFSKEYVTELREEAKANRIKAQEWEAKYNEAATKLTQAEKDADVKVKEANKAADAKLIKAEMKALAVKEGIVDIDGLTLADLSKVKFNDKGELEGATESIAALKEGKPYLFGSASTSSTTKPPPVTQPGTKRATEMTDEEYAAAEKAVTGGR